MKAILCTKYGSPEALQFSEVEKPIPAVDRILVKVHAASLNIADWYDLQGGIGRLSGGFQRPKDPRVGRDFAGTVESVGSQVTLYKPGDEVYGTCPGSFAEYATAREDRIAHKPTNCSFEEAATVPVAGLTALQGSRDAGHVQAGQKVLIDGASGGVGTFTVQVAKSFGAEVTAVCSTGNVEIARSIGADHVIDYSREDFAHLPQQYDLILNVNGNHSIFAYRRALYPNGTYVMMGGSRSHVLQGFAQVFLLGPVLSRLGSQKIGFMGLTKVNHNDLESFSLLLSARKVVPVIDKRFPLSEAAQAYRYMGNGHTRGKVVLLMQ